MFFHHQKELHFLNFSFPMRKTQKAKIKNVLLQPKKGVKKWNTKILIFPI